MSIPVFFKYDNLTSNEVIDLIMNNRLINNISFITSELDSENDDDQNLLQPEEDYLHQDLANMKVFGIHFLDLTTNLTYTIMKLENTNFWRYASSQFHLF